MIETTILIAAIKTSGSFAAFGAAITGLITAERSRQFELARDLGTLTSRIEDRKLLGQDYSDIQQKYDHLLQFKRI